MFLILSCRSKESGAGHVQNLQGYIVYILPDNIKFVQTKRLPDTNYKAHFSIDNFAEAISFDTNCITGKYILNNVPDTLFDENPDIQQHASFLKRPLVFPAEINIVDTSGIETGKEEVRMFKMIYQGKPVQFHYKKLKGFVLNLRRI